jgi:hypothetical protein
MDRKLAQAQRDFSADHLEPSLMHEKEDPLEIAVLCVLFMVSVAGVGLLASSLT